MSYSSIVLRVVLYLVKNIKADITVLHWNGTFFSLVHCFAKKKKIFSAKSNEKMNSLSHKTIKCICNYLQNVEIYVYTFLNIKYYKSLQKT